MRFPLCVRVALPFCLSITVAFVSTLAGQEAKGGAAAPALSAQAKAASADDRVAAQFRELAAAKGEEERARIISSLHAMATSKSTDEFLAVGRFGQKALSGDERAVMLKAMPILIAHLDGTSSSKAWWVLIGVQPKCPLPKKEAWEKWWQKEGKALYEGPPAAGVTK